MTGSEIEPMTVPSGVMKSASQIAYLDQLVCYIDRFNSS